MEIVTEPDLRSGNEAAAFVNELQLLLKTLSTGDGQWCMYHCNLEINKKKSEPAFLSRIVVSLKLDNGLVVLFVIIQYLIL